MQNLNLKIIFIKIHEYNLNKKKLEILQICINNYSKNCQYKIKSIQI